MYFYTLFIRHNYVKEALGSFYKYLHNLLQTCSLDNKLYMGKEIKIRTPKHTY